MAKDIHHGEDPAGPVFRRENPGVFEWEWEFGWFSAAAKCGCGTTICLSGRYDMGHTYSDDGYPIPERCYSPRAIFPTPQLFVIPDCTSELKERVEQAFSLFWSDTQACCNRIRTCVEQLLDDKKIKRRRKTNGGKLQRLDLAKRIDVFSESAKKNKPLADHLTAIRWIGNDGSHGENLTRQDALDGFQQLDFVLDRLYVGRIPEIKRIAKQVTTNKRARSRQKR